MKSLASAGLALTCLGLFACSHAKTKSPVLSEMEGKKVALVDVDGDDTERNIVEVALVNELQRRGTFILLSQQDVETARIAPRQDPTDWVGIARRAGADYALRVKVLQFDADIHQGYSSEIVEDSQLAEERGPDDDKMEKLYKVKSLEGHVKFQITFAPARGPASAAKTGIAERQDKVIAEAKTEAAHLPPRLGFLENLSNLAFRDFFDKYN